MGTQAHNCTPCLTKSTESTLLTVYLIDKQDPSPPGQEKVNTLEWENQSNFIITVDTMQRQSSVSQF